MATVQAPLLMLLHLFFLNTYLWCHAMMRWSCRLYFSHPAYMALDCRILLPVTIVTWFYRCPRVNLGNILKPSVGRGFDNFFTSAKNLKTDWLQSILCFHFASEVLETEIKVQHFGLCSRLNACPSMQTRLSTTLLSSDVPVLLLKLHTSAWAPAADTHMAT